MLRTLSWKAGRLKTRNGKAGGFQEQDAQHKNQAALKRLARWGVALGVFFGCFAMADLAFAQDWPVYPLSDDGVPHQITRGPGHYFSWLKLGAIIAVYFLWVRTCEWANQDCQKLRLPYATWNPVVVFPFPLGAAAALTIPIFPAGFAVMVLLYAGPLLAYVFKRNSVVDPHQRVMTPAHMRFLMAQGLQKMGLDVGDEAKAPHEKGVQVEFTALGGTDQQNQANIIHARQSEGFLPAKELISEIVKQRSDKVMLDFSRDAVQERFQIDGVWHASEGRDRESGDLMLAVFKGMANLNVDERKKRQVGRFKAEFEKVKYNCMIISQGTKTGERVIIQADRPGAGVFESLEELGMRDKIEEKVVEFMQAEKGMVLFSSPPSGGLTTTLTLALGKTDRFLNDFVAFQDEHSPEPLAPNIDLTTFDSKTQKPETILESLLRREPDAVVVNEFPNAACVQMLCNAAIEDKLVIGTVRAKESVEALLRVLLLKVPASTFAPAVIGVVNQRLIRRLCDECKEEFEPSPQLLKSLGIPAGRIERLYKEADPNERDKVCPKCNGIGYYGRTAIFETLTVDDTVREVLVKQPKLEILRQASRKGGNRTLKQEGILLVAKGITSVQELSRVLKAT